MGKRSAGGRELKEKKDGEEGRGEDGEGLRRKNGNKREVMITHLAR